MGLNLAAQKSKNLLERKSLRILEYIYEGGLSGLGVIAALNRANLPVIFDIPGPGTCPEKNRARRGAGLYP